MRGDTPPVEREPILTAELAYADPDLVPDPHFRDGRVSIGRRAATIAARAMGIVLPNAGVASDMSVRVRVDRGRYIVECPFCRGAQFASRTDPIFLCCDCFNRPIRGALIPVEWPRS